MGIHQSIPISVNENQHHHRFIIPNIVTEHPHGPDGTNSDG